MGDDMKKSFWVSWYSTLPLEQFEYHGPWWVSGYAHTEGSDGDMPTVCAAVRAPNEDAAKAVIIGCYDNPPADLLMRFVENRAVDWSPFSDRFPRDDWMKWPDVPEGGRP